MANTSEFEKVEFLPGDMVCLTKLGGHDQDLIKVGDQYIGMLSNKSLKVGEQIHAVGGIRTSVVTHIFFSFTTAIIKTENSIYMMEKLPKY